MDQLLQSTLTDVVDFLSSRKIAYALIGGVAASFRGQPRVTADVDLVIGADVDDALQLLEFLDNHH